MLNAQASDAFENDALIYSPSESGSSWHKTSQCVWSSAATLRGRISLNDDYEDLEELFVDFLGVRRVDLQMAVDELKEVGNSDTASLEQLRESIWTVNSLLPTESTLPSSKNIVRNRIFPIRNAGGSVMRGSIATSFFVVDREQLGELFAPKVKLLDFTLEDVVRLRAFFDWTGLDNRYLSNCVKETTSVSRESVPVLDPNRQVRNRAHAILR